MKLQHLHDQEILDQLRNLVQRERDTLTEILHHLREVETRKLFSDLKYQSLFEYCVKELKYSEGQAGRRIQAMRLLRELPILEDRIKSGTLSLTNLSQAQSYFREKAKSENIKSVSSEVKLEIIEKLDNTSSREAEKILISLNPTQPLPPEKERPIDDSHSEIRFVINSELKEKLEMVRSLLGTKAIGMSFAELVEAMAELSTKALTEKRFGKKSTPAPDLQCSTKTISKSIKYQVWLRDNKSCNQCGSRHNLNYDHVYPKAYGGTNQTDNLQLLCFHCNQRKAIATFGNHKVHISSLENK